MLPQVVAVLKSRQVIKRIPFRSEHSICQMRGINRQAYNTIEPVLQIEFQRFHLLFFLRTVFLIGFLFSFFLLFGLLLCFFLRFFSLFH